MCDKRRTGLWAKDSKKHNTAPKAGAEGWATIRLLTVTVVGGYRDWPTCLTAIIRMANSVKVWRPTTPAKLLYVYDKLLERLAQDFQDVACALGPFIQEAHPVVRQRHLPGPRHLAAADQADVREGVVGRTTRARGDQGVRASCGRRRGGGGGSRGLRAASAPAGCGAPARQHRLPGPRGRAAAGYGPHGCIHFRVASRSPGVCRKGS
jgi:hypothetical protein